MVKSIVEAIAKNAAEMPDKFCLADSKVQVTYKEYYDKIQAAAANLLALGAASGDKIVEVMSQTVDCLAVLHAIQLIGAVVVPLERNDKEERTREILDATKAKILVVKKPIDGVKCVSVEELISGDGKYSGEFPESNMSSNLLFTTGTTGKSKGVLMSHSADVAVSENIINGVEMKKNNVEILPMPLNHSFGLRRYYANMLNGSTGILMDGVIFVNVLFNNLDKFGATSMAVNPSALSIMFKLSGDKIGEYADQLDYVQTGSAHISEPDKIKLCKLLPKSRLYNFYGSTEAGCSCILDFNSPDNRENCIGKATCNSHFKVVGDDGKEIDSNADNMGRLICGGGMCMTEYFGEPALTAETMIDGYVYSNDLGYITDDGFVFLFGRCDDVINTGGNKVSPSEVEDAALQFPGVRDCACVPAPDAVMGQVPKLFVVKDNGYDEGELLKFLGERLEYFQVPKIVDYIDEIPKTFNGKPLRRKLYEK
jgi:long-chain acyl-CoA synthetase